MSAAWNNAADANVHAGESANSLPMLEMPGCAENQRLLKAVAVIKALTDRWRAS